MKGFLARGKVLYQRGSAWLSFITSLGIISVVMAQFNVASWGISHPFIFAAILYFVATVGIGWIDLHHGIWKQESDVSVIASPPTQEMLERLRRIEKTVGNCYSDGK